MKKIISKLEGLVQLDRVFAYADDIAIIVSGKSHLDRIMGLLVESAKEYGLEVNIDKTKVLILAKRYGRKVRREDLQLSGYEVVDKYKYLGIILDERSPKDHLKIIKVNINSILREVCRYGKTTLNPSINLQIWKTFINPHIIYTSFIAILCPGIIYKISNLYTGSLKRILKIPPQTNNKKLFSFLNIYHPNVMVYKAAWRIFNKIMNLTQNEDELNDYRIIYDKIKDFMETNLGRELLEKEIIDWDEINLRVIGTEGTKLNLINFIKGKHQKMWLKTVTGTMFTERKFIKNPLIKCNCETQSKGIEHHLNECKNLPENLKLNSNLMNLLLNPWKWIKEGNIKI